MKELPVTRIEDWQQRRRLLLTAHGPHNDAQLKVLNYVIDRYRDSKQANQPARFPLQSKLHWNSRRILVHHHLGQGKAASAQNKEQAEARICEKLAQMTSANRPPVLEFFTEHDYENRPKPYNLLRLYGAIRRRLRRQQKNADRLLQKALWSAPTLPNDILRHLTERLAVTASEDINALALFQQCQNRNILTVTNRIWRNRVGQGRHRWYITQKLAARLVAPGNAKASGDMIRLNLADESPVVRMAACELLPKLEALDDVGLLTDILSLSESIDGSTDERQVFSDTLKTIAEHDSD